MKGKWDLFFSFHADTEPAGLGWERTWGRSELKCVTGKMASLDVPARWVEGFGPSASALLFVEQGGIVILYFHVFFQNAFLNYYYFKKTTISVTLTNFRKIYMCWTTSLMLGTSELREMLRRVAEELFYVQCWGWEKHLLQTPQYRPYLNLKPT